MKLLAAGDLHLGRRPSRLPASLGGREQARALGPAGALERLAEAAVTEAVDAVVFAGDVVEREDDFFEAYRELQRAVNRLVQAGIRVFGVAGNHDWRVLPRLAGQCRGFRLLGAGGAWESELLEANGERLTVWGWSFSSERVLESPLSGVTFERGPGPNIGILHCDRDQAASPYAPVAGRELEAAGLDGWLLGHIHNPDALSARRPAGYLGSVSGSDPSEAGARGPWLIGVSGGRIQDVEQWVLAPLRWETLEVNLDGVTEIEHAKAETISALKRLDDEIAAGRWPAKAVGLRIRFTGRSRFGERAGRLFTEEDREQIYLGAKETHYFVERVENGTRPEIPLEELAARKDPPGLLAARLLLLERPPGDAERERLLSDARRALRRRAAEPQWAGLRAAPPDDEETAAWLRKAGMAALEKLFAQNEKEAAK